MRRAYLQLRIGHIIFKVTGINEIETSSNSKLSMSLKVVKEYRTK